MAAAEVDAATHTITLGGGARWRDMDSNVLFIRYFYRDLWEVVLNMGQRKSFVLNGAIILGTPGSEFFYPNAGSGGSSCLTVYCGRERGD